MSYPHCARPAEQDVPDRARLAGVNERLATIAAAQSGVLGVDDAARVGVGTDELTTLVRRGALVRVRRGAYVLAPLYLAALPSERYVLRVKAVMRSRPTDRASHQSALALLGIDRFGVRDVVSLESPDLSRSRVKAGLATHPWSSGSMWRRGEFRSVSPAVACVQVAATEGFTAGVCAMDCALRQGLCDREDLERAAGAVPPLRRSGALRAVAATDGTAESVGETRTRIILTDAGFAVRSQVVIEDDRGFVGRVDFLVGDGVIVEFDGLRKYAGADGQWALAAEKAREERLSRLGYEVVRIVWSDLDTPARIIEQVRQAERVARERRSARARALR